MRWQGPDWTNAPTFPCFRRACVRWLVFPTPPLGGFLSTFLPVMPPVMRLHLIGAVFCDGRGQIGLTHRRSCAFDGRAVACLSYSPFRWLTTPLSGVALTSTCILFAALRACWSRRSQVDMRACRALDGRAARTTSRRVSCFARRATAAAAGTLSPQRSPWSQPPRRRVGWSFSIAGASSRRLRLPRSIGC